MAILDKGKALLDYILKDVTQEQAVNSWDGEQDNPTFPSNDQRALAIENRYAEADVREALAEFERRRREFIALVKSLPDAQGERRGQHPYFGETTILTQAVNSAIHDLDHIEQIARALGKTQVWG